MVGMWMHLVSVAIIRDWQWQMFHALLFYVLMGFSWIFLFSLAVVMLLLYYFFAIIGMEAFSSYTSQLINCCRFVFFFVFGTAAASVSASFLFKSLCRRLSSIVFQAFLIICYFDCFVLWILNGSTVLISELTIYRNNNNNNCLLLVLSWSNSNVETYYKYSNESGQDGYYYLNTFENIFISGG